MGGVVAVMGGLLPSGRCVGVVTVAVLATLPVAVLLTVARIITVAIEFAAMLGNTVLPLHGCHVAPPLVLNCGFSRAGGNVSVTVGVLAVSGPLLVTVTV